MTYSVTRIDIENNEEQLNSLWRRNFGWLTDGRFQWAYKNNPHGSPVSYFLQHDTNNAVVGAVSLFTRKVMIESEQILVAVCGDLVVDHKHRALGPVIKLLKTAVREWEKDTSGILIGFPNDKAETVMQRAGFRILDNIGELTQVIRTRSYLNRYVKSRLLAKIISWPLDWLLRVKRINFHQPRLNKFDVRVTDSIDANADALWERIVNQSSYTLIGERTQSHLNWRFSMSPHAHYRVFSVLVPGSDEFLGYLIFSKDGARIQIDDIGFSGGDESLEDLLSLFYEYQRSQGAVSIHFNIAGNSTYIQSFLKQGYSMRSNHRKIVIYCPANDNGLLDRIRKGNWYLTSADNDI